MLALALAGLVGLAMADSTARIPGTSWRLGMPLEHATGAGFRPGEPARGEGMITRAADTRFYGLPATVQLVFRDRRLIEARFAVARSSSHERRYIGDDLVRRGHRQRCEPPTARGERCRWSGATEVEIEVTGDAFTARVTPGAAAAAVAAPGASAADSARARAPVATDDSAASQALPADELPALADTFEIAGATHDGPRPIERVHAHYPEAARRASVQGVVRVLALVDTSGRVVEARMRRSIAELDSAALEAVRGWRFEPYVRDGVRRRVWVVVPFRFTLH